MRAYIKEAAAGLMTLAMALPVLRHRVLLNFKAEAENISPDDVTRHLLKAVHRPGGMLK